MVEGRGHDKARYCWRCGGMGVKGQAGAPSQVAANARFGSFAFILSSPEFKPRSVWSDMAVESSAW